MSSKPCDPCLTNPFGPCPPLPDCERQPDDRINQNWNCCTLCQGDKADNVFFVNGKCKLDEISWEQLYLVLRRSPQAHKDLVRITNDPVLLRMAREAKVEMDQIEEDQAAAKRINANTLPFYTLFRGNFP